MSFRRAVSALLLIAYLPACTSFQSTSQPLTELTAPPKPIARVQVTNAARARVEVWAPLVEGDTLRGYSPGGGTFALPLSTIRLVEVRKTDWGPTILLTGVSVLFLIGVVSMAAEGGI